jgi:hypothetical protein
MTDTKSSKTGSGPSSAAPKKKVIDLNAKFGFTLTVPANGKTAAQVKAHLRNNVFYNFGTIDQIIITPHPDKDAPTEFQARVLFTKLHAKGEAGQDAISRGDEFKVDVFDDKLALAITTDLKGSGGGRATGTAQKPSTKPPARGGRGGATRGGATRGGAAPRGGGRGGASTRGGKGGEEKEEKKDEKKAEKKEKKGK